MVSRGQDTALLTWASISGATDYHIMARKEGSVVLDWVVTDTSATLTGLPSSSTINVTVAAIVAGVEGHHCSAQFQTLCGPVNLPFTEDFSDEVNGSLPYCWDYQWAGQQSYYHPQVTGNPHYLKMWALDHYDYSATEASYVTLPAVNVPMRHTSLKLRHRPMTIGEGNLKVGYWNDTSFVEVHTISNRGHSLVTDTLRLSAVSDSIDRLVLCWYASVNCESYMPYIEIYEVSLFMDNSPQLTVDSLSAQCVGLRWTAVENATAYHVRIEGVRDTVVYDTSVTLCGLTVNTQYSAFVAAILGADTGAYAWAPFTTPCRIISLPLSVDFEQDDWHNCWYSNSVSFPTMYGISRSGNYSWHLYGGDNLMNTPVIEIGANQMRVTCWVCSQWAGDSLVGGAVTRQGDISTFIPLGTCHISQADHWFQFEFDTRALPRDEFVAIAFHTIDASHYIFIDDLQIEAQSTCARLLSAEANPIDLRSVELQWQYDPDSDLPPTGVEIAFHNLTLASSTTFTATGTSHTFTGLTPGHLYRADLRTLCGSTMGDSLSVSVIPTATPCAQLRGANSDGWALINADRPYSYSQTLYPASLASGIDTLFGVAFRLATTLARPASRLVDVYIGQTSDTNLSAPVSVASHTLAVQNFELSLTDTGWLRIHFTNPVPLDGTGNLIVTVDDNTGQETDYGYEFGYHPATFGMSYITSTSDYNPAQTYDPYNPSSFYTHDHLIPDIQLLGGCAGTGCQEPMPTIDSMSSHSVDLSWTQRGSESLWLVAYRSDSATHWTLDGTTTDTHYSLQNLNAYTDYLVRVASLCTGDTLWSDTILLRTPSDPVAGIDNLLPNNPELQIYPNPTRGNVTIHIANPSQGSSQSGSQATLLTVHDLSGRTVLQPTTVHSTFIIPHSTLSPGTYFVRVTSATGTAVRKLIVQ